MTDSDLVERYDHVVFDTAPTGHTSLLFDATGSYHRDVVRHAGSSSPGKLVTPMMRLQNPELTKILLVTLPETTPALEASHLQNDLRRADIEPWGWIINSSLAAASTYQPLLRQRARSEQEQIVKVRDELSTRYAVVPMQATEPVGIVKLQYFVLCQKVLRLRNQVFCKEGIKRNAI